MLVILKHKNFGHSEIAFVPATDLYGIIARVHCVIPDRVEVWNVTETESVQVYPKAETEVVQP